MLKNVFAKIARNKSSEYIIVFLAVCLFSLEKLFQFCTVYSNIDFDSQALLTWNFTALNGMLPYKELFYPYGILPYLRDQNILFHVVYFLIFPTLSLMLFITLKKLWRNRVFSYVCFAAFFAFILKFVGVDSFSRYGVIIVASCILANYLYQRRELSFRYVFLFGLCNGLVFGLLIDQGIYLFFLYLFSLIIPSLYKKNGTYFLPGVYKEIIKKCFFYFLGFIVGFFPHVVYLVATGSLIDFWYFITKLGDLSLYAKTAFFPGLRSPENIFTFIILLVTLFSLAFQLGRKETITFNRYLQMFLVFSLVMLEQKNIIRSIDNDLTFIGLLILFTILFEYSKLLQRVGIKKNTTHVYFSILFFILIVINPFKLSELKYIDKNSLRGKECIKNNVEKITKEHSAYKHIVDKLNKLIAKENHVKIFSFPGDPVFYILLNQNPPYYSNSYDASLRYAQDKQVLYLKNNNVQYVLYNTNITAIQDGVPDFIRVKEMYKYIFTNYAITDRFGAFLILTKKKKPVDFLRGNMLDSLPELEEYFLHVDLSNIPRSEGIYRESFIRGEKSKIIISSNTQGEINAFFKKNNVLSKNLMLIITEDIQSKNAKKTMSISIMTKDDHKTTIRFARCKRYHPCIINFSNLPIFFYEREIMEIIFEENFLGNIALIRNS